MSALLKRGELPDKAGAIRPFYETLPPATRAGPDPPPAGPAAPAAAPDTPERHLRLLERIVEEMVHERRRLLTETRPELLKLVFSLVREVIRHEVAADPGIVEHTLTQALQNLHFATRIVVHLHPDDLSYLQEHAISWREQIAQLELVPDPEIERGGCRLESDRGGFDATLQTQLATMHEALGASYNG